MELKEKELIINNNPLPTIEEQVKFGFTRSEAKQNLKDSEIRLFISKDVKEAVLEFRNCIAPFSGLTASDYLEKFDEIFGDFKEEE